MDATHKQLRTRAGTPSVHTTRMLSRGTVMGGPGREGYLRQRGSDNGMTIKHICVWMSVKFLYNTFVEVLYKFTYDIHPIYICFGEYRIRLICYNYKPAHWIIFLMTHNFRRSLEQIYGTMYFFEYSEKWKKNHNKHI